MVAGPLVFEDRAEAGKMLSAALPEFDPQKTVVVALPRGGVPVAAEICAEHALPLDLVFVRKIGVPIQPELAVGAVTDGADFKVTINHLVAQNFGLTNDEIEGMARELLPEIERRRSVYLGGRAPLDIRSKTIIVVDDGVATGATLEASLRALKDQSPARVIVAMPVGPDDLDTRLRGLADEVVCLSDLRHFGAVGGAYRKFPQVDDDTVRDAVQRFAPSQSG